MRNNLLALVNTQSSIDQQQGILSTGLKVNSALDNPTSFFAAQGLSNRANDLSALLDSMGQAISTLQAVDKSISSMTKYLTQMKAVAQTAQTKLAGNAVITGTHSFTASEMADLDTVSGMTAADTFTITLNGAASPQKTVTVAANETMATLLNDINNDAAVNTHIKASLVADTANAGQFFLRIESIDGSTIDLAEGTGTPATDFGLSLAATTNTADTVTEKDSYVTLLSQFDQLVSDASYRGKNLLAGDDLTVQFNEKNTASMTVSHINSKTSDLGLVNATNAVADFKAGSNLTTLISKIDTALATLRSTASTFGNSLSIIQSRQEFTTNMINVLQSGSDKLTVADKNEESAKLLALQTSQSLGIQALALASQSNQSVLKLFQ